MFVFIVFLMGACAPFYEGRKAKEIAADPALFTCTKAEFRIIPDEADLMAKLNKSGYRVVGYSGFEGNGEESARLAEEKAYELGACLVLFGRNYPVIVESEGEAVPVPEGKFLYRAVYAVKTAE